MKILAMSDIHGEFVRFAPENLPPADVVIIAGDVTNFGRRLMHEMLGAAEWFSLLDEQYPHIFWIPGNHDLGIDDDTFGGEHLHWIKDLTKIYSHGSSGVFPPPSWTIHGVSLCPCYDAPELANAWTHMTTDAQEEAAAFRFDPVDIIVSHSPPKGCRDGENGQSFGSERLRAHIETHQPQLVICGHIHESVGGAMIGRTAVLNCAQTWVLLDIEKGCTPQVDNTEAGWGRISRPSSH